MKEPFGTLFALIFSSDVDYSHFCAIWDKFALNSKIYADQHLLMVLFGKNLVSNIGTKDPYLAPYYNFFNANNVQLMQF